MSFGAGDGSIFVVHEELGLCFLLANVTTKLRAVIR